MNVASTYPGGSHTFTLHYGIAEAFEQASTALVALRSAVIEFGRGMAESFRGAFRPGGRERREEGERLDRRGRRGPVRFVDRYPPQPLRARLRAGLYRTPPAPLLDRRDAIRAAVPRTCRA
jgi:hypothetical protein